MTFIDQNLIDGEKSYRAMARQQGFVPDASPQKEALCYAELPPRVPTFTSYSWLPGGVDGGKSSEKA